MKRILAATILVGIAANAFAWDDNSWEIRRKSLYGPSGDNSEVELRQKYNPDPESRYHGTIDNSGEVRLRNYDGDTIRGRVDENGYGYIRDDNFNTIRVRPRY